VGQLLEVLPGFVWSLKYSFLAVALDDIADGRNSLPVLPAILDMPHFDAVKRPQQFAQR
jgi:hypothetical protein